MLYAEPHAATVVIPTLDGAATLGSVLAAIDRQVGVPRPEVLVIDSGSVDDTLSIARSQGARTLSIRPEEFGHGRTRNLGASSASHDLVVFLSQDAVPADEDWLRALVSPLRDEGIVGTYSRQLPREGGHPFLAARQQGPSGPDCPIRRVARIADRAAFRDLPPAERFRLARFDNVSSCIQRRTLREWPFRDVAFGEDVDWALRVLLAGHGLCYEPRSRVFHTHDLDLWYELKRTYLDHDNLFRLFGLRTIPTLRDALVCTRAEARRLRRVFRSPGAGRHRPSLRVIFGFALVQALGQWLGPACAIGRKDGRRSADAIQRILGRTPSARQRPSAAT